MYPEFSRELAQESARQRREYVERRRLETRLRRARRAEGYRTLRARTARRLFAAAFALDARESWRAVWDRMSPGGDAGEASTGEGERR